MGGGHCPGAGGIWRFRPLRRLQGIVSSAPPRSRRLLIALSMVEIICWLLEPPERGGFDYDYGRYPYVFDFEVALRPRMNCPATERKKWGRPGKFGISSIKGPLAPNRSLVDVGQPVRDPFAQPSQWVSVDNSPSIHPPSLGGYSPSFLFLPFLFVSPLCSLGDRVATPGYRPITFRAREISRSPKPMQSVEGPHPLIPFHPIWSVRNSIPPPTVSFPSCPFPSFPYDPWVD